ncbi:MAG TPA: hypothetical protein DD490_15260 [Acidobacteria bacterium]|nr:hypothetical protein [Acidobacteriota bacterium]
MRELARSMASFSWAISLFGVEQVTNLMSPRRVAEAFGAVTRSAEGTLGPGMRSAFQMGDRLQRAALDLSFGLLGAGSDHGLQGHAGHLGLELAQAGTDAVYWMAGTAWARQEGPPGWGPVEPRDES